MVEAHHIRNRSSQLFKAVLAVDSKFRWCLTGTPIHNSLDDYAALLSFLRIPFLTEKSQFDFWVTSKVKEKRPDCFNTLGDLIRATCLRRTKSTIQDSLKLPTKTDRTQVIEMHQEDQLLYQFFKEKTAKIAAGLAQRDRSSSETIESKGTNILTLINFLRRICDHGEELLPQSVVDAWRANNSVSVDWQMMRSCNRICDACDSATEDIEAFFDDSLEFGCCHSICNACSKQSTSTSLEEAPKCPKCAAACVKPRTSISPESTTRVSAKVRALIQNISAEQGPEKNGMEPVITKRYLKIFPFGCSSVLTELIYCSVVFSQWTKMLDLISRALTQHGFQFQRIDGQCTLKQRNSALQRFNEDTTCTVMLASIGSAGEG